MDCLSLLFLLIMALINWQPISSSCENVNECVNKVLSRHPKHKEKEEGFRHACRHACEWRVRGEAQRNGTLPTRPKLTPKQQAWLDSLKVRRAHPTMQHHPNQNATTAHPRLGRATAIDKAIRKEIRVMSDDERTRLFDAFNTLKTKPIDGKAMFDILINDHYELTSPEAHQTAAFLPYHREMLYIMETALTSIDPKVSLPYWASVWDYYLPDPADSILWTDLFLGGNGDVTSGPFKNWKVDLVPGINLKSPSGHIYRELSNNHHLLYSKLSLEDIAIFPDFKQFTACTDFLFEGLHGSVHAFVGGYMNSVPSSPNDPVFYMHHAFVDSLWEAWRFKRANAAEYVKDSETCGTKNDTVCGAGVTPCRVDYGSATMPAFKIKVEDAMSNIYTELYYEYDYIGPHGTADLDQNSECSKSPYIYATPTGECLSKIRIGGNCKGFEGEPICYDSKCVHGVCV